MSVQFQVSQVIDRPVATVFDFTVREHVRNHPRWDPYMELEQVTEGPIKVGTIIRRRNSHSGSPVEGAMEVVEFEPDHAVAWVIHDGNVETRARTTFESLSNDRTNMTVHIELPHMDETTDTEPMAINIQRSFQNIKQLIETET